jgi:RNA polymerase sporulation-specific sigma factor
MKDDDLIAASKLGDEEALENLLRKHKGLVRQVSKMFSIPGADEEDALQEGMIGLFKAVKSYNQQKRVPFRGYAQVCIRRQIVNALKQACSRKHRPLNSYVPLQHPNLELRYFFPSTQQGIVSPEEAFFDQESRVRVEEEMLKVLSSFEQEVLSSYLEGDSYYEIAERVGCGLKSIDNALSRAKRKLNSVYWRLRDSIFVN